MNALNSLIMEGEFTELKDDIAILKTERHEKVGDERKTRQFTFRVVNRCEGGWDYLNDYAIPISIRLVGRLESDDNGVTSNTYIVAEHVEVSIRSKYIGKKKEEKDDNIEPVGEEPDNITF